MGEPGKVNQGKIQRVLRELVATLVEEVGADETAQLLESAAARLRGATRGQKKVMHENPVAATRPRAVNNR